LKRKATEEKKENRDDRTSAVVSASASSSSITPKVNRFERKSSFKSPTPDLVLKGVVFALSGFQNPLRGELRDIGLKLGAKYRPDWMDDCTHLV
jgi:DNA-repair protein XRCC1